MEGTEIQYNLTQTIIIIIVVTLILLLILKLLKYIFPLLPRKERTREWIKKNFVYAESIIWMIYIAIIIPYLHKTNIIFEIVAVSIILIVIILIGYYFGRDLFAGIVFKFAYKIKEGDFIQYNDTVGKDFFNTFIAASSIFKRTGVLKILNRIFLIIKFIKE